MTWFRETLHAEIQESIRIDRPIYEGRTQFQSVQIFANETLGRVLVLDGVIQTTETDEFVYHEMLAHPPALAHGAVREALIIGGGDGGCLEEVLKHPVDRATMVDLDGEVVALCREFLPALSNGAFDDPRTDLIIGDGAKFVAETERRFDLIIVDSTDPIGPGTVLFERPFYAGCRRCLNNGGILITQNGVPIFQPDEYVDSLRAFRKLFDHGGFYYAAVPTYIGGDLAFGWAGNGIDLAEIDLAGITARYAAQGFETRYYNPQIHQAAFATPNYLMALIAEA